MDRCGERIYLGLLLLPFFGTGFFLATSHGMELIFLFLAALVAVAIWIFYMNLSLMARIIKSTLMKAFLLLLGTGIVQLILEYILKGL